MPHLYLALRAGRRTVDLLLIVLIGAVLVAVVLARGLPMLTGGTTFVVAGGSMEPSIPMGSVVLASPVEPDALRVADVVSLQTGPEHAVFTHRILRLATLPDGRYIETKGDANPASDPALVPATDVIGRVDLTVPYVGYGIALLSSIQGVLFVCSLASVLLVAAWLLESLEGDKRLPAARATSDGPHLIGPGPADAEVAA
jgi:signal peptidase I